LTNTGRTPERFSIALDWAGRLGPERSSVDLAGHPYTIFRRALERGNLMGAEATAKQLPQLGLADALELTLLIARKDPRRHPRVAARWLLRYLEEDDEATIDELALCRLLPRRTHRQRLPGSGPGSPGHDRKGD
jgi:hypothetical protein